MGSSSKARVSERMRGGSKKRKRDGRWLGLGQGYSVNMFFGVSEEVLCLRHGWLGRIIETVRMPRGTFRDSERSWRVKVIMALVQKAKQAASNGAAPGGKPAEFARLFPTLADYMYDMAFADGEPRKPATVTIMAGDNSNLKMVLNDRQEAMSLWATGTTLADLFLTMETLLNTEDAPWRKDMGANYKKKVGK